MFYELNHSLAAGVLPAGLTHLTFSRDFNQPVAAGVLRTGLAHRHLLVFYEQV